MYAQPTTEAAEVIQGTFPFCQLEFWRESRMEMSYTARSNRSGGRGAGRSVRLSSDDCCAGESNGELDDLHDGYLRLVCQLTDFWMVSECCGTRTDRISPMLYLYTPHQPRSRHVRLHKLKSPGPSNHDLAPVSVNMLPQ